METQISFERALEYLKICLNTPVQISDKTLISSLETLCEYKASLSITPSKCIFCKSFIAGNSFSLPCSHFSHKNCLQKKLLKISPDLRPSTTKIKCKICKKTYFFEEIFTPKEISIIQKNHHCPICKEMIKANSLTSTIKMKDSLIFICECSQNFHKNCLKEMALHALKATNNAKNLSEIGNQFLCSSCNKPFDFEKISLGFDKNEKKQLFEKAENLKAINSLLNEDRMERKRFAQQKSSICGICGENKNIENEFITLECEHRFCKECLMRFISIQVNECKCAEKEIACPECKKAISSHIIKYVLPQELYIKYDTFMLQHNKNEITKDDEIIVKCPKANCNFFVIMAKKSSLTHMICDVCKEEFCVKGCRKAHQGKSCEEMKKLEEWKNLNNKSEAEFLKMTEKEKFRKCPKCHIWVEKTEGCNHITCKCEAQFCYVCGSLDWKNCGDQYTGYNRCRIF